MAKRELSSTLKNLKFMQRAALREDKTKKEDEVKRDDNFGTTTTIRTKCVVIMEGDPHPGALKGRMSFQSFNPSVDKLNEEEARIHQPAAQATNSANQSGNMSFRENGTSVEGPECSKGDQKKGDKTSDDVDGGELKRKQPEVISETQNPNKSPKIDQGDRHSPSKSMLGTFKKPKGDKLNWNALRPPKDRRE